MDHMHLVVKSEGVGDVGPLALRLTRLGLQGSVEPDNPRVEFGREANLFDKPALELADAEPGLRRCIADVDRTAQTKKPVRGSGDRVRRLSFPELAQKQVSSDTDSLVEARCVSKLALKFRQGWADYGTRVIGQVGQRIHRHAKQSVKPGRAKLDGEHVEFAVQDKFGVGSRTGADYDRAGDYFLPAQCAEANSISALQIELEKLIRPGGDRVNDWRVANTRSTLLKASDVFSKLGSGRRLLELHRRHAVGENVNGLQRGRQPKEPLSPWARHRKGAPRRFTRIQPLALTAAGRSPKS